MPRVLASLILLLMLASGAQAESSRARFDVIQAQEAHDPESAFAAMMDLAHSGFAPAANRVGFYYRHGLGTPKDLHAARRWYRDASSRGHPWAFASLARVELALEQAHSALQLLQTAARDRRPGAARLLGTAHIDGAFGGLSDTDLGQRILMSLEKDGDADAARELLLRYNWNRIHGRAPDHIVTRVVQTGLDGNARFAEAALVYLSRQNDKRTDIISQRNALIEVPGIRRRTLLSERIRLAADIRPERFWTETENVLQEAENEHFAHVARVAFRINRNAWVRVLQKELRTLGYYSGRINSKMTAQTIRAQIRFCKDKSILEHCAAGPLRVQTVHAVAGAIALMRDGK